MKPEIIEKNAQQRKQLLEETFEDVIDFYNKHCELFLDFERKFGFNIWFLYHFRLYHTYFNWRLKQVSKCDKKQNKPSPTTSKTLKIIRILKEGFFLMITYRFAHVKMTKHVLLSNASDMINGVNKRFGSLTSDFSQLHNRPLFDIKRPVSLKDFAPKGQENTDIIFINYLLKLTFIKDLFTFIKDLSNFKKKLTKLSKEDSSTAAHINQLFWKSKFQLIILFFKFKSFDQYFKNTSIQSIVMSDENSPQQKIIQYVAKRHNIKIYALQHGNIFFLHPAYMYGAYHHKPLLPDKTFTWGSFFSELLIDKGGFNEKQVVTTGRIPPPNQDRRLNPSTKKEKKIILFASQPQEDKDLRYQHFKDVLLVAKKLSSKYSLVVRPHPREIIDGFFEEIAEECQFHDFIIDRISDLKTHFEICHVLIIAFSTVGSEFIPYYKPLLVLDYLNQDLIGWIEEGVGQAIQNQKRLLEVLKQPKIDINQLHYEDFIKKYFYKNDDLANERIRKIILATSQKQLI